MIGASVCFELCCLGHEREHVRFDKAVSASASFYPCVGLVCSFSNATPGSPCIAEPSAANLTTQFFDTLAEREV